ncbi:formyltransferase family protein, partial [Leisingera sp.]|uniref:formyltransferase family protein n=1 Tax=Leisingera sp. TaxID=1879318 RepID=UPI002B271935
MTPFTCALIGNETLLIGCADALLARGHRIRAVVSKDPGIRSWAGGRGLTLLDSQQQLQGGFDWLLSIANLTVIPQNILALAAKGAVNFHDGPLPAYAGLNTPNWALINGEAQHGISWHLIEGGVDEGDILAQRMFGLTEQETAFSLNSKCYAAAMDSFGEVIAQLETGDLNRQPQDLSQRRVFAKSDLPAAGGLLDFSRPAAELARLVRALDTGGYWNPLCAAKLRIGGRVVLTGAAETAAGSGAPGTVLDVHKDSVKIATADGALVLSRLTTPAGRPLEPAGLIHAGGMLPALTAEDAETLTAKMAVTQAGEQHWRQALAAMQPVQVPLASDTGNAGMARRGIALPGGLNREQAAAGVLAWALLSSGETTADVALSIGGMNTVPGLISDWVPLQARQEETASDLQAKTCQLIEKMRKYGGFAEDLVARAPEISGFSQPAIGLSLDKDAAVSGCTATVAFCGGTLALHTDQARLESTAADLLAARLELVLVALAEDASQPVSALPMLPDSERKMLLEDWNRTATDYPSDLTIHAAFEAQAANTPDAVALVFEDQSFTSSEVNARANAVAGRLREMDVKPGTHAGIHIRRGPELVFAALGV